MARYELPMFPLEHVLLPGSSVSLVLFEPRYMALGQYLAGRSEAEFGIVGIERGREVGGGETRSDVGVVARVVEVSQPDFPEHKLPEHRLPEETEGRWSVVATGTRRIVVDEWLRDDPYPVAAVHDWPDPFEPDLLSHLGDLVESLDALVDLVRARVPSMAVAMPELDQSDPDTAVWQVIQFSNFGAHDAMKFLEAPGGVPRARHACRLIDERRQVLDALSDGDR